MQRNNGVITVSEKKMLLLKLDLSRGDLSQREKRSNNVKSEGAIM